jgi:hypothetical protein
MKIPDRFPERFSPLGFTISLIVFIGGMIWAVKHKYAGRDIETIGDAITGASLRQTTTQRLAGSGVGRLSPGR